MIPKLPVAFALFATACVLAHLGLNTYEQTLPFVEYRFIEEKIVLYIALGTSLILFKITLAYHCLRPLFRKRPTPQAQTLL